jgi:hypothetical protein
VNVAQYQWLRHHDFSAGTVLADEVPSKESAGRLNTNFGIGLQGSTKYQDPLSGKEDADAERV